MVVFDGNSLTRAPYPALCIASLSTKPDEWWNFGVGGQSTQQMTADAATQIDPLLTIGHTTAILVAWEWKNDSSELATRMAAMQSYCEARKAAGWDYVVVLTGISAYNEVALGIEAMNTWIRENYTDFADALADVGANEFIGCPGNYSDTTYFNVDQVHLTTAGYNIVAGLVKTAIESL